MYRWFACVVAVIGLTACATEPSGEPDKFVIAPPRPEAAPAPHPSRAEPPRPAPAPRPAAPTDSAPVRAESAAIASSASRAELVEAKKRATHAAARLAVNADSNRAGPVHVAQAKSSNGNAAYYVPKQMVEQDPSTVDLWIDRATPVLQLQQELAKQLQINLEHIKTRLGHIPGVGGENIAGDVQGLENVLVGEKMFAQLRGGADFDIDPKDATWRLMDGTDRVRWTWRVTPLRAADKGQGLLLVMDVWIDPGPGKGSIPSIEERVIVTARAKTWAERLKNLNDILDSIDGIYQALIGLGVIGGIGAALRKLWKHYRTQPSTHV